MTPNSSFNSPKTSRSRTAQALVIIGAFVAAICWWIGLTGYVIVGGPASGGVGLLVFIAVPAATTLGTYLVARRTRRSVSSGLLPVPLPDVHGSSRPGRHRAAVSSSASTRQGNLPNSSRRGRSRLGTRDVLLATAGFAAALFWWIGLTGYLAVGGAASGASGAAVFLAVPAAATAGTFLAARRRSRRVPKLT